HKVVIVGGGTAGITITNQLLRSGSFAPKDIALIDPATWHHYQPGWTLVGGGLKNKTDLRKRLQDMIDPKVRFYNEKVREFKPEQNTIVLSGKADIGYEQLIVYPGIKVDFDSIPGLQDALADPQALVSSIYSYDTCDKTARIITGFKKGAALFTHPTGTVKCAGAPQKIMWMALDRWKRSGLYKPNSPSTSPVQISFATGMPVMFGVPKYSKALDELRMERGVQALFHHDLVAIEGNTALLATADRGEVVKRHFDLLHVVPKMGPHDFIKNSALADGDGFVDVHHGTLQHRRFPNIWSCGDVAGLPTSKTAAAITMQAPVVVSNLLSCMQGKDITGIYNGYTSCPLITKYGEVMLAEFAYGGQPHETFGRFVDQAKPNRAFYYMKKYFFPWVYFAAMVKGRWAGPKGWKR
ncbi:FAD/NAD(P)-binding domain-containing protein, partial [Periconia macrospinosa]